VEILGIGKVKFKQTKDALTVTTPKGFSPDDGFAIRVELQKDIEIPIPKQKTN
jgi:hypothetical protein